MNTNRVFDTQVAKKAINLSVNSDLLRQARLLHLNISQILEQRLAELLKSHQEQQWLEENKQALEDYNARIEKDGVFSDGIRRF